MEQSLEGKTSHFIGRTGLLPLHLCLPQGAIVWLFHPFPLSVHHFLHASPSYPEQTVLSLWASLPASLLLPAAFTPSTPDPICRNATSEDGFTHFPRASQGPGEARRDWQHLQLELWPVPGAFSLQTDSPKWYHQRTLLFWQKYKFPSL